MVDNIEELEILTYDGLRMRVGATSDHAYDLIQQGGGRRAEIYARLRELATKYGDEIRKRYPDIPRRVSGYNLDDLLPEKGFHVARALVGSESTCALTLSATVRLIDFPPARALVVLTYESAARAADEVTEIRALGPLALEGFQRRVMDNMARKGKPLPGARLLPEAEFYLMVEFGGADPREANANGGECLCGPLKQIGTAAIEVRLFEKKEDQGAIWDIREIWRRIKSYSRGRGGLAELGKDAAVPPRRLGDYLRDFDKLNRRYGYRYTLFGHFGDGCVHTRMTFGLKTPEGVRKFRAYMEEASNLCLSYGGSLSGEHGDGQAKGELLPKMFGPELIQAFREFKTIWDPHWRMNPGKIIDARPLDENLRVGPEYRPKAVKTHFSFAEDAHTFAHAAERCFGVGKCRALDGQTMCPSFQATREEMHSKRGRAHLLFEMMRGDTIKEGWRSDAVREALDLCLQCKGCKHDCPVSVDMATCKAEFLSHYYQGRLRPRAAYSMGLIFFWSRLAMLAPGVVNAALRSPAIGPAVKWLAGFTQHRAAPAYAAESFQTWWSRRRPQRARTESARGRAVARHVLQLLSARNAEGRRDCSGGRWIPRGGPHGAALLWSATLRLGHAGSGAIQASRHPICAAASNPARRSGGRARAELPVGVPRRDDKSASRNPDARKLARQAKTLSELPLETPRWHAPRLERKAVLHTHCHHKSILDAEAERKVLESMGLELQQPSPGRCGHAGSFGYEIEHHRSRFRSQSRLCCQASGPRRPTRS